MCIQIYRVTDMPADTLVWVDRQAQDTLLYVDTSLYQDEQLTAAGRVLVDEALLYASSSA